MTSSLKSVPKVMYRSFQETRQRAGDRIPLHPLDLERSESKSSVANSDGDSVVSGSASVTSSGDLKVNSRSKKRLTKREATYLLEESEKHGKHAYEKLEDVTEIELNAGDEIKTKREMVEIVLDDHGAVGGGDGDFEELVFTSKTRLGQIESREKMLVGRKGNLSESLSHPSFFSLVENLFPFHRYRHRLRENVSFIP